MKKYIHIGYPKNFSTSLQRNYFSAHTDIYHLGIGIESNLGYKDELISSIFEVYLKTAKCFKYKEQSKRIKEHIDMHYQQALNQNKKCFGVSSEHLSFAFTYDSLDFKTKISRLVDLFGKEDLNFIIIARNQVDVIKSLYRESVRVGLLGSFQEYIYSLYKFQDRNYLYDFRYDLIYSYLESLLPKENIHFMFFEHYRDENKEMILKESKVCLIDEMSQVLGVDYLDVDFRHFNEALTDEQIIYKSKLNEKERHDLGREMLFSAEIHRQKDYFSKELKLIESEEIIYQDVITKRNLIKSAKSNSDPLSKLSYSCDSEIEEKIIQFYVHGNQELSKMLSRTIPESFFEMNF